MHEILKQHGIQVYLAYLFAKWAHRKQKRKYTGAPYIEHPVEVMRLVASVPHNKNMLIAALLHDTVEDCGVSYETIQLLFGNKVETMVWYLTDPPKTKLLNRAARKAGDRWRLSLSDADTQTVKLADLISNTKTIKDHDPDFAKVYLKEKAELLAIMKYGNPKLYKLALEHSCTDTVFQSVCLSSKLTPTTKQKQKQKNC
jgi:(p)ppGpp synthase/HD superfamily hydrolase